MEKKKNKLMLEVYLPDMSGLELQEKLVTDGVKIPVIFVSACDKISSVVQAFRQGAINFLEKPCRPEQLRKNIHQAIELDEELRDRR